MVNQDVPGAGRIWAGNCVYINAAQSHATVLVTIAIYVAVKVPVGGCSWRVVLDHEAKHGATADKLTAMMAPKLGDALAEADLPTPKQQWWGESDEAVFHRVGEAADRASDSVNALFERESCALQAEIDRPESVAAERALCPPRDWRAIAED